MNTSTRRGSGSLGASLPVVLMACALTGLSARETSAQTMSMGSFHGYLTGFIGGTMGGSVDDARQTAGASVSVQETTGWGAEFDFGRTTDAVVKGRPLDLTTYMFNMTYVSPLGRIRPFASAGGGIHQVDDGQLQAKTYNLGLSGGGGVFLLANDVIGIRADARYFYNLGEHPDLGRPERFGHWRATVGFTYLWQMAP